MSVESGVNTYGAPRPRRRLAYGAGAPINELFCKAADVDTPVVSSEYARAAFMTSGAMGETGPAIWMAVAAQGELMFE